MFLIPSHKFWIATSQYSYWIHEEKLQVFDRFTQLWMSWIWFNRFRIDVYLSLYYTNFMGAVNQKLKHGIPCKIFMLFWNYWTWHKLVPVWFWCTSPKRWRRCRFTVFFEILCKNAYLNWEVLRRLNLWTSKTWNIHGTYYSIGEIFDRDVGGQLRMNFTIFKKGRVLHPYIMA